jgi:creatinine amidohydrolase
MKKYILLLLSLLALNSNAQFSVKWEELTTPEFIQAVSESKKVCVVPLGIVEKHGAYLPLGTDLYIVRDVALRAAKSEYVVVFPEFFIGQINESRHQPGTIAYSPELVWKMLEETLDEIARNGFKKIILINGHGGNNSMLSYLSMALLSRERDYTVYFTAGWDLYTSDEERKKVSDQYARVPADAPGHAGADEAAEIMVIRPDLVKLDHASKESGKNQERLKNLTKVTTGIDWYSMYPNQYAGDAHYGNKDLGNALLNATINGLIKAFQEVKSDTTAPALMKEFYDRSDHPLETPQ